MYYLIHYGPGDGCVRGVQNLSHQHWFEEGPGDGSSCGIDHVQVHVHTEGSYTRKEENSLQYSSVSFVQQTFDIEFLCQFSTI